MTLPRASASLGWPALRRLLIVLALLATGAWPGASHADDASPYTATIKVDATADTAGKARDTARIEGQRRALYAVIDTLSGTTDKSKQLKLTDATITDMVDNFDVANERMSAVRYLADYTFRFRPNDVRRIMQGAGLAIVNVAPATPPGGSPDKNGASPPAPKPAVLLPVFQDGGGAVLWDDPNPWRQAWGRLPATIASRLVVPLGDVGDVSTVDADQAIAGKAAPLTTIAQSAGAEDVVVALAKARREGGRLTGLEIAAKRYRAGTLADSQSKVVDARPNEDEGDLLKRAAEEVAGDVISGTRKPSLGPPASLTASVVINSLPDWVKIRARLSTVPGVRKTILLSMTRQEVLVDIQYQGNPDQLKTSLAAVGLDLVQTDSAWRIETRTDSALR